MKVNKVPIKKTQIQTIQIVKLILTVTVQQRSQRNMLLMMLRIYNECSV